MNEHQDILHMTADTIGKDLLSGLVCEIKLLPDPWQKLSKAKQDDVIDRLRARVESAVKMAVHLISSQGRTVVVGDLEQITIKNGTKAVIKIGRGAESLHELYDAQGKAVLIVVADAGDHTGGMDEIHGEADQRGLDLGHEYHDNDGGGMDGVDGEGEVIEGEVLGLPAPGNTTPTDEELQKAFEDGYKAAADGKPESDCPIIRSELVIQWIRGHKAFHEQSILDAAPKTARLGDVPNDAGVYTCEPDEQLKWGTKKDHVEIELLELENGQWLYATKIQTGTIYTSSPLSIRHGCAESREAALRAVQSKMVNIYAKGEDSGLKGAALKDFTNWVNNLVNDDNEELAA